MGKGLQENHSDNLICIHWNLGNAVPGTSFIPYSYLQDSRRKRWDWTYNLILFDLIASLTVCQQFLIWSHCKMWNHPDRMHLSGLVDTWETFLYHIQSWISPPNLYTFLYILLNHCSHSGCLHLTDSGTAQIRLLLLGGVIL